jgi:hypothetical protein
LTVVVCLGKKEALMNQEVLLPFIFGIDADHCFFDEIGFSYLVSEALILVIYMFGVSAMFVTPIDPSIQTLRDLTAH